MARPKGSSVHDRPWDIMQPKTPPLPESQRDIVPPQLSSLKLLPPNYEWRRGQRELVQKIVDSPKKIVMLEAECGTGKSLIAMAAAKSSHSKAIVLIQTVALQEQYMRDFAQSARMMAGRRHSICDKTNKRADWAPCTVGIKCELKGRWDERGHFIDEVLPECSYYRKKAEAQRADVSIQNYSYWLKETKGDMSSFDDVGWIVCDEGHELDQILMAEGTIEFTFSELRGIGIRDYPDIYLLPVWQEWADHTILTIEALIEQWSEEIKTVGYGASAAPEAEHQPTEDTAFDSSDELINGPSRFRPIRHDSPYSTSKFESAMSKLKAAKDIKANLDELLSIEEKDFDDWVMDISTNGKLLIKPIYGKYAFRRILAAATDKVVIMSAFLAPKLLIKTLDLDPNDVEIIDAGRVFDRSEDKIYYCPLFKFNYNTSDAQWKFTSKVIDRFINYYAPKKGLLHVPSLRLRNQLMAGTMQRNKFIAYDNVATDNRRFADKNTAINNFINLPGQKVLIGQSISTGLDIPMVPEFQIIPKIWYMPLEDPAVKKRKEKDPSFYDYHTICQIIQATGRVKRSQEHHGQTIILDAAFAWFWAKQKDNFPRWFRDSLVWDGWSEFAGIKRQLVSDAIVSGVQWKK